MNTRTIHTMVLAIWAVLPMRAQTADSIEVLTARGDSCMQQYNTHEALGYYQQAYNLALAQSQVEAKGKAPDIPFDQLEKLSSLPKEKQNEIIERLKAGAESSATVPYPISMKLADCHYRRANYREASELLKRVPEDSLSHEAFRQLAYSYQKLGDMDSYVYWTEQLVNHFPMDGEMVAGLVLGQTKQNQAWKGIETALNYCKVDSTNILVNRALGDAYFMDRQFDKATGMYERLLQQGDSTFNTLYSAGMSYSQIDSLEQAYHCLTLANLLSGLQHYGAAYRLGVVCVDTKRYEEGLGYLNLALELMQPDSAVMRAITLSQGEGYYLTKDYPKAVEAWKRHLDYNPGSVATYYNIANAYAYLLKDDEQAELYYRQFSDLASKEKKPTQQLTEMMQRADNMLRMYEHRREAKLKSR